MSRSKPPFHKQETPHSCVPTCLRTALASFGLNVSESELRTLCDTTIFGTAALKTVDAAHALGFTGTAKHNLTLEELTAAVDAGLYPIVFVNLDPISGKDAAHAFVVVEASASDIMIYDPLHGEHTVTRDVSRRVGAHAQRRGSRREMTKDCGHTFMTKSSKLRQL